MSRFDTFMTKPERDRGDIHLSLEQMQSGRVANDMGRDVFGRQAGARGDRTLDGVLSRLGKCMA